MNLKYFSFVLITIILFCFVQLHDISPNNIFEHNCSDQCTGQNIFQLEQVLYQKSPEKYIQQKDDLIKIIRSRIDALKLKTRKSGSLKDYENIEHKMLIVQFYDSSGEIENYRISEFAPNHISEVELMHNYAYMSVIDDIDCTPEPVIKYDYREIDIQSLPSQIKQEVLIMDTIKFDSDFIALLFEHTPNLIEYLDDAKKSSCSHSWQLLVQTTERRGTPGQPDFLGGLGEINQITTPENSKERNWRSFTWYGKEEPINEAILFRGTVFTMIHEHGHGLMPSGHDSDNKSIMHSGASGAYVKWFLDGADTTRLYGPDYEAQLQEVWLNNEWLVEKGVDADGDGFLSDVDCDDTNADINPDQDEIPYNGLDDDCNVTTLDDDLDQDGFVLADDCDDTSSVINPDQMEIEYNGIDDDCDAETLDDDLDQDGFPLADDCNDTDPTINPNATDIPNNGIDENCDGMDEVTSSTHETLANHYTIYPNPTADYIHIDKAASETYGVSLYNIRGEQLTEIVHTPQLIDLSSFAKGVYMLHLREHTTGKVITKKIIKL